MSPPPPPDPIEHPSPPAMDSVLPDAVVATILSRLDVRSLLAAAAACRRLRSCASHALSFLPSFFLLEVALTHDLLRPLLPPNPSLRSLRLDCARLQDAAISCLARPGLHELLLLNCENISGRLLRELGATCRDLRVLSLNSLAERRGLPISFYDLEELLSGCSQLEGLFATRQYDCCSLSRRSGRLKERMAAGMQVFGQPASTDVARVLTCLFEKNLEFELVRIDTFKREHKLPEFIKLRDPNGQVTFKHGDKTLVDSRAICRYVCTQFPNEGNKTLYGTGSLERASIEQWLQAEAQNFSPPSSALVFHLAFAPHLNIPEDKSVIAENEKKLQQVLNVYEEVLSKNEYLAGDELTLADLSHLPNSQYIVNTERGKKLFTSRKNVARWYDKISKRRSWEQVVKMQMEHPGAFE